DHFDCGNDTYFDPTPSGWLAAHWNLASTANTWIRIAGLADAAAPQVSIASLASGYAGGTSIAVTATDDAAIDRVETSIDGGAPVADFVPPFTADTSALANGSVHTIQATAFDTAGLSQASQVVTFTVDRSAPGAVPAIFSGSAPPANAVWNPSRTQISGSWNPVADTGSPVTYEFCFTSAANCTTGVVSAFTSAGVVANGASWTGTATGLSLLEDGTTSYKVCVMTRDAVGNSTNSYVCQGTGQKVDATAPPAVAEVHDGAASGADLDVATVNTVTGNWTATTDNGGASPNSGMLRYQWCASTAATCNGSLSAWTNINATNLAPTVVPGIASGTTWFMCVRPVDAALNAGTETCSDGLTVDSTPPPAPATVTDGPVFGVDAAWTGGSEVTATWPTVVDAASGIARYEFCISLQANCDTNVVSFPSDAGVSVAGGTVSATRIVALSESTTYYACARAVDGAGNTGATRCSNGVRLDATAPLPPASVLDGASGASLAYSNDTNRADARWGIATDPGGSGVARYEWCVATGWGCTSGVARDWSSTGIAGGGTGLSAGATGLGLTQGTWYACVRATDNVGLVGGTTCSAGVTIDTTPPTTGTITSTSHSTAAAVWTKVSLLDASWSGFSDARSSIGGYAVVVDQAATTTPTTTVTQTGTSWSQPYGTNLEIGLNYIHVRAMDRAGNWGATAHYGPMRVDFASEPSRALLSSTTHTASSYSTNRTVSLNITPQPQDGAPITGYSVRWTQRLSETTPLNVVSLTATGGVQTVTSQTLTDGPWYAHVEERDAAGNWNSEVAAGPYNIDTTPPLVGSIDSTTHGATYTSSAYIYVGILNGGGYDPNPPGGGGGSGIAGYAVSWDSSPSTVPATTITQTSISSGPAQPLTGFGSGTYYVHIRAVDAVGNWGPAIHGGPYKVDVTAPTVGTVSSTSHTSGAWSTNRSIALQLAAFADSHAGLAGISVEWDNSPTTTGSTYIAPGVTQASGVTSAQLAEGQWYAHVRAVDAAGNWSATAHAGPFGVDTAPPTTPVPWSLSHPSAAVSADPTVDVGLIYSTDSGSGLRGYAIEWDHDATTVAATSQDADATTQAFTSQTLTDGVWYVHVRPVDALGTWGETAHGGPFTIDATGPAAGTLSGAPHGAAWRGDHLVTIALAGFADPSGVAGYSAVWDHLPTTAAGTTQSIAGSATSFSSNLVDGSWYVHVRAVDGLGTWGSTVHGGPFNIDSAPPVAGTIASSSHTVGPWSNTASVQLVATGFSDASPLGYDVSWTSAAGGTASSSSLTSPPLASGTWTAHVTARDAIGNVTAPVDAGPYRIDLEAPTPGTVSSTSHSAAWSTDATIDLGFGGFADTASGIDGYSVLWDQSPTSTGSTTKSLASSATGATSPPRTSGRWYAHVRAVDTGGSWSQTVHAGPFAVDVDAPSSGTVASTSHTTAASTDTTVDVHLTGFTDPASGIAGYAVVWDSIASTTPATTTSLATGGDLSSPALAPGTWYVHVRPVDTAGTWGVAAHAGPFTITDAPTPVPPAPPGPVEPVVPTPPVVPVTPTPPPVTPVVPPIVPTPTPPIVDHTTGSPAVDRFLGTALADLFRGLAGNDSFTGGAGNDRFFGGTGNDRGDGGTGNDQLSGDAGNDTLIGGPGVDKLLGGAGNDVLNAADGKPKDLVDCGPGAKDTATVNKGDVVKGCEKVIRR
ncbi:MAG: Peptidase, partial [Thermoleophilia bacterium]|nr:Peptidase [Thermoleophilia bacterium]